MTEGELPEERVKGGPPQAPGFKPVSRTDLRKTSALAAGMVRLAENASDAELAALGIRPEDVDEARAALAAVERVIPSARNTVLASLADALSKEMILTGYARAQRAIHALAPLVVLRLAEKIDDANAQGSTRVLLELGKGLGLFVPAEPMAPQQRSDLLSLDDERKKPLDELKAELLRRSQ